jgi:hypothetical protein
MQVKKKGGAALVISLPTASYLQRNHLVSVSPAATFCRLKNAEKKTAGATSFSLGDNVKISVQAYQFLAQQESGCHRCHLKSGKICLEPPQMK